MTTNTDGLYVENVKFYNLNEEMTAIGTCAICWFILSFRIFFRHLKKRINGGATTHFKNMFFDTTVKRKIWWEVPRKEILHDIVRNNNIY